MARTLAPPAARILTVCLTGVEVAALPRHVCAPGAAVRSVTYLRLRPSDLRGPGAPSLVLSPLICHGFDCMDLLTTLREANFGGRYLILARSMPHVALIRRELHAVAGMLNVDIVPLDGGVALHLV